MSTEAMYSLLGTEGGGGGGKDRVPMSSLPCSPTREDGTERQPPPSQCEAACVLRILLNSSSEQSHKDSVRKATVEEQLSSKTIHPAMRLRAQLHLPALDLSWALTKCFFLFMELYYYNYTL